MNGNSFNITIYTFNYNQTIDIIQRLHTIISPLVFLSQQARVICRTHTDLMPNQKKKIVCNDCVAKEINGIEFRSQ